jgi:hypothetical protein
MMRVQGRVIDVLVMHQVHESPTDEAVDLMNAADLTEHPGKPS